MAVDRLSSFAPAPAPPQAQPARNVRQAQAAFFQAALGKAQGIAAPEPRPAAPAPTVAAAPAATASEPKSGYRPGSLLDIRI